MSQKPHTETRGFSRQDRIKRNSKYENNGEDDSTDRDKQWVHTIVGMTAYIPAYMTMAVMMPMMTMEESCLWH